MFSVLNIHQLPKDLRLLFHKHLFPGSCFPIPITDLLDPTCVRVALVWPLLRVGLAEVGGWGQAYQVMIGIKSFQFSLTEMLL